MREPTFLVLTALAGAPQHGYALLEEVRRISDGQVELRAGTLYAALDRLRTDGLVEVEREELVQSRLRRYYRLTALGARRLAEEAARLRRHADAASARLRRTGPLAHGGPA
jgi:DNA-binding PadR family transcriptional regulator